MDKKKVYLFNNFTTIMFESQTKKIKTKKNVLIFYSFVWGGVGREREGDVFRFQ
jgi:hypothetical protein